MQRRSFIKTSCKVCLLGAAGIAIVAESCSPKNAAGSNLKNLAAVNNVVTVPLAMLSTTMPFTVLTIEKYPFEVAVEKRADESYHSLLLMCTHQENPLTPTGAGYTCSVHGSRFSKEGKVVNGPAEQSLHQLKTTLTNTDLVIQLEKI